MNEFIEGFTMIFNYEFLGFAVAGACVFTIGATIMLLIIKLLGGGENEKR